MGKTNSHNNMLNQYAQSWVFDTDTVGPNPSDAPYNKLPSQFSGSKTVVLKRKQQTTNHVINNVSAEPAAQPVVVVEDTNGGRQLPFMTSFSRTPSPVPGTSDGDSSSQCSNPPAIYECLERLTEPSMYRARLNTAIGTRIDRASPSVSPRPHSAVISEQVQYASLMMELNKTIETKFPPVKSPFNASQSPSQLNSRRASSRDESQQKSSTSDAEFSKELEAALQLIQDLESPGPADTPEGLARSNFPADTDSDTNEPLPAGKTCVIHNEGNKTIISFTPQKKYTSIVTIAAPEHLQISKINTTKELSNDVDRVTKYTKDLDNISQDSKTKSSSIDSRIIVENGKCNVVDRYTPVAPRVSLLSKHKSFKDYTAVEYNNNTIHKDSKNVLGRSVSLTEKDTNSLTRPRWSLKTLLKRKPSQMKLTPELESAILKSESLAHLTEVELIARYNQSKLLQRVRH